jgi:ribosomal protein L7/L12
MSSTFAARTIRLYSNGYVQIGIFAKNASFEKLLGISGSANVAKKTGIGRAAGALLTGGANLLTSNKRGDVYLTIITDTKTYAFDETPGIDGIQRMNKLVTAGESILKGISFGNSVQPAEVQQNLNGNHTEQKTSVDDLLRKLQQLGDLHASGVVSETEFDQLKEQIMGGQTASSNPQKVSQTNQSASTEDNPEVRLGDFDVILEASPDSSRRRISMIKEFREIQPDVSLKDAKYAIDNPPTIFSRRITYLEAQGLASRLEEFGAKVKIDISSSTDDEELIGAISAADAVDDEELIGRQSIGDVKVKNEFPKYVPSLTKDEANEELAKLMTNRAFSVYQGYNGSVSLFDNRIEVLREGLVAKMGRHKAGVRAIEFTSIVGVYQKAPTVFANGYIKFLVFGELNNNDQKLVPTDRNAIMFTYQHRKEQDELFAILEQVSNIAVATFAANEVK